MKTGIEKVYYTAQDPKTYLVAALSDQVTLEEFCIEMAKRNSISALLPVQDRFMNGASELLFDISGKSRLIDVFKGLGDAKAMALVLHECCKSLTELYDYFLHPAQCILDDEYIFMGQKKEICFALAPISSEKTESSDELQQLFLKLVGSCSAVADRDKADILAYLIKPTFSLQEFKALLEKRLGLAKEDLGVGVMQKPAPDIHPTARPQPSPPVPKPVQKETTPKPAEEPVEKKSGAQEIQIPGGGKFAIPTGDRESEKKAPKESKKLLGGFFSKKKDEQLDLNVDYQMQRGAVAPPIDPPARKTPVSSGRSQSGDWRGTVQIDPVEFGCKTEFSGETSSDKKLIIVHNGRQIAVTSFPFTVGRELCSYIINNPKVSRQHITISLENGIFRVTDNNSFNHTYYNNTMLAPFTAYDLADGVELRLGNEVIIISIQ